MYEFLVLRSLSMDQTLLAYFLA